MSAAWGTPSRDQRANLTHFDWPSLSGRQVLLFRASACDELTPPLHRAPPGPQTGRSQAEDAPLTRRCSRVSVSPWFRCHRSESRCVSSGSLMLVFSSHTCPDPAGTFPQRSRPRLLTDAACGGLGSPPVRRTRRVLLHHWHSMPRIADLLHRQPSTSGHTTDHSAPPATWLPHPLKQLADALVSAPTRFGKYGNQLRFNAPPNPLSSYRSLSPLNTSGCVRDPSWDLSVRGQPMPSLSAASLVPSMRA